MSDSLNHLGSIWYHSEALVVFYSPNQFLGLDFNCRFFQQTGSLTLNLGFSGKEQMLLLPKICEKTVSYSPYWSLQGRSRTSSSAVHSQAVLHKCLALVWQQYGKKLYKTEFVIFFQPFFFNFQYRKLASSNMSHLEAHAGFFRLLMKGIFDPYHPTLSPTSPG